MSHALRTTLLLGGFWLLVFMIGFYQVRFRMKAQEEKLLKKEQQVREELETDETLVSNIPAITQELEDTEQQWIHRTKIIPRTQTAHGTYDYLDRILKRHKTTLNFDFVAKGQRDSADVHYADYQITGEARFLDLYQFIWYLEYLPRYIQINSIDLAETNPEDNKTSPGKRWVHFTIDMTSLAADREGFDAIQQTVNVKPSNWAYDPFGLPRESKPKIPANTRGLPNIFSSTLRAITPNQVYLVDQKGALRVLSLGDEVYLGKLVDIIPDENRAIFDLNQLYPPRRVPLEVNTGQ